MTETCENCVFLEARYIDCAGKLIGVCKCYSSEKCNCYVDRYCSCKFFTSPRTYIDKELYLQEVKDKIGIAQHKCFSCGKVVDKVFHAQMKDFTTDWNIGDRIVHVFHKCNVQIDLCESCYSMLQYYAERPDRY